MGTERNVAGRFSGVEANSRLEPLAVLVDETDEGDRRAADLRCQERHVVIGFLGQGVEDLVRVEFGEPLLLVGWYRCCHAPFSWVSAAGRAAGDRVFLVPAFEAFWFFGRDLCHI